MMFETDFSTQYQQRNLSGRGKHRRLLLDCTVTSFCTVEKCNSNGSILSKIVLFIVVYP